MVRSFAVGVLAAFALVASGARAEGDEKAAEGSGSAEAKPSETTGAKEPELKGKKHKKRHKKSHKKGAEDGSMAEKPAAEKPAEDAPAAEPEKKE